MKRRVFLAFLAALVGSSLVYASTEDPENRTLAFLTGTTWQLEAITQAGETLRPDAPGAYTLLFDLAGRLTVQADCNRGVGRYLLAAEGRVAVQVGFTRAFCPPESLFDPFSRHLEAASSFFVTRDRLELISFEGEGTMSFVEAEPDAQRLNGSAPGTETGGSGDE